MSQQMHIHRGEVPNTLTALAALGLYVVDGRLATGPTSL